MNGLKWGAVFLLVLVCLPFSASGQELGEVAEGSNLQVWITGAVALLGAVIAVLREIAPKTPNDFDDKALAMLSAIAPTLQKIADPDDPTTAPTPDNPSGQ